jgi:hypothetical protein
MRQQFPSPSEIKYFESFDGMSFCEQVTWMSNVDILISPHGAQLTNTIFLPQCGGILEFFPKGFYPHEYFGTLARSTGHYHFGIYASQDGHNDTEKAAAEIAHYSRNWRTLRQARTVNMTLNAAMIDHVIEGVEELTERWRKCRKRGSHPFDIHSV